jgi:hypothetical protein
VTKVKLLLVGLPNARAHIVAAEARDLRLPELADGAVADGVAMPVGVAERWSRLG